MKYNKNFKGGMKMDSNINDREEIIKIILDNPSIDLKDKEILSLLKSKQMTEDVNSTHKNSLSKGDIMSDKLAAYAGSWKFIITFVFILVIWIIINIIMIGRSFDPYPFILLNLLLSCLAAIQAPIIMMSQNRQEQKDRARGEHDYKINLKAELEIKILSEKIDHLLVHQNKMLLEIQELQTDYLEDLMIEVKKKGSSS